MQDQYESVNFEEELAHEKEADEGEAVEYQRLLELARKTNRITASELVKDIINTDEDPLDDTEENINAIIEYVVGEERQWATFGSEMKEFRSLVSMSFDDEWQKFTKQHAGKTVGEAMQKLPAVYHSPPLPTTQFDALTKANASHVKPGVGVVRARINYHDNFGNLCSIMREIAFTQTAQSAIEDVVERIHTVLGMTGVRPTEYMFKVVGRSEFVYGSAAFIDFRYVRDSVVKQQDVKLYIMRLPFDSTVLSATRFAPQYPPMQRHVNPAHDAIRLARLFTAKSAESQALSSSQPACISLWDCRHKFSVRIDALSNLTFPFDRLKSENVREGDDIFVCVVAEVVFGGEPASLPQRTPWRCCKSMAGSTGYHRALWGQNATLTFDLLLCDLPREARLCLSVVGVAGDNLHSVKDLTAEQLLDDSIKGQEQKLAKLVNLMNPLQLFDTDEQQVCPLFYLASVSTQVFDHTGTLRSGLCDARMWASEQRANRIAGGSSNPDPSAIGCRLVFPEYALPVVQPAGAPPEDKAHEMEIAHHDRMMLMDLQIRDNKIAQLRQIKRVLATDPLYTLTATDKILLWQYRLELTKRPKALCKFLLAVDWMHPAAVHECHMLMDKWSVLQPMDALELLDARYADTKVRQYAIECLDKMPDNELKNCVLQLVQTLKYEPYHYSALARFLLKRSIVSPHLIGHSVFWHLKAEMCNPAVSERHGLIIEEYLRRLPSRREVLRQHYVTQQLLDTALRIKESKKMERLGDLRESLGKIQFPASFSLPLNPTMECNGLIISKCKVMESKKLPLWLLFKNADPLGGPIYVMFKAGDDLRQDLLTLQMIELMDNVWKSHGLDLHMIPYGCVSTGDGIGMIEIVLSSQTIAEITRKDGGAQAAFSEEPLMNWLRKYNRSPQEVERCLWNFVYSCAGYCVATYILGIGDRHNDNIMVREDGTLFHIDFGHFLGNFKTKFGFKRETAPFIFTPMYSYMMGGTNSPIYHHFTEVACQAYNIVRQHSNLLIILFALMLSTGIPELQSKADIMWLKSVLLIDSTNTAAANHYRQQITDALNNKRTLINDYIHIVAH